MTSIPAALTPLTRPKAVRFLQRATFGGTPEDVDRLMSIGIDRWFDEQFAMTPKSSETMLYRYQTDNNTLWNAYWAGPMGDQDQLRKRVTYAMSQIFVSSRASGTFRAAHYNDVLEEHCFETFRTLLEAITLSPSMSRYLTYHGNKKANDKTGSVPDENYAREIMQLFTIGLFRLNLSGRRWRSNRETYTNEDIAGLARVFTGIRDDDFSKNDKTAKLLPLTGDYAEKWHEMGEKTFLGTTIPKDTPLKESVEIALDTLATHPNTAPFICKQLIQRLVTSNPEPGHVRRVALVFTDENNPGDMKAVIRAILLDPAAWRTNTAEHFGKIREPVLRFTIAARAFNVQTTEKRWRITDLTDDREGLGMQPWMSPSVFNFYRPGYVPPQTALVGANPYYNADQGRPPAESSLVSPEMQIVNETTTIGWINFVSDFLRDQPHVELDFDDLTELVADTRNVTDAQANALIDELELRLCPAGLSTPTRDLIFEALKGATDPDYREPNDPKGSQSSSKKLRDNVHLDRVVGAATLILASTDFIWER